MKFTRLDIIKYIANTIKSSTVILVTGTALSGANPWTIAIISIVGGAADKLVSLIKSKELEK